MESVLGVISPNISSKSVTVRVAIPTPFSPNRRSESAVKSDDRRMFTKSFATSSVFIKSSFLSRSFPQRSARLSFLPRRIRNRSLFIARKELSEMEKSIDNVIRITQAAISPADASIYLSLK